MSRSRLKNRWKRQQAYEQCAYMHYVAEKSPHTTVGSGSCTFVRNLTGLTHNTTYYYRAYASNAMGTMYGAERTLTTN